MLIMHQCAWPHAPCLEGQVGRMLVVGCVNASTQQAAAPSANTHMLLLLPCRFHVVTSHSGIHSPLAAGAVVLVVLLVHAPLMQAVQARTSAAAF